MNFIIRCFLSDFERQVLESGLKIPMQTNDVHTVIITKNIKLPWKDHYVFIKFIVCIAPVVRFQAEKRVLQF